MIGASALYSFAKQEWDPNTKIFVKSLTGEYTGMDLEFHQETQTQIIYLAKLNNDKQTLLGDLQAVIPQNKGKNEKQKVIMFPDELNGLSVANYNMELAERLFNKGKGYLVFATFDNLYKIIQPRPFYNTQHRTVYLAYLKDELFGSDNYYRKYLDLNPVFQRGNVWTLEQQIAFVENFLRRPQAVNRNIYFNDGYVFNELKKNQDNDWIAGKRVCLDGLQRITALLDFMDGKFACFDGQVTWEKIQNSPNQRSILGECYLDFYDLTLKTNQEVLDFYVDFNAGGTPHSKEEIERVKLLLDQQ